ncbi:unnamed protein product [Caenorhabditis bovis]|uniref:Store-operated calcium entry-associated regulatory factor n=1 Tax=Caenorhabditis bovis TaxID=2654633 RepID=A0A8S1EQA0_9PELO|nr:unnamed protein product [Caenorhabditis bovis]
MIDRYYISLIIWISLVLFTVILETSAASDRVKLRDVSALTLYKGKWTTGRRSSPTLQLKCIGGSAKGAYEPKVVQCSNQGFDGTDVQWRCDADLPHDMEFGAITVSCEGYDYPDDPYILKGSCGLEYELDYNSGSGKRSLSRSTKTDPWDTFSTFVVVAFILFVIYTMYSNWNSNGTSNYRPGGGPGGGGGGGGGPGGYPGAPPPYDDTNNGKPPPYGFNTGSYSGSSSCSGNAGGANAGGGGGFWTGAGLGAIGAYLASNYLNGGYNGYGYARPRRRFMEDTGFATSDSYYSGPSTSTRSSSGYGGTTRR